MVVKEDSVKVLTVSHDSNWTHASKHVTGGESFRVQLHDERLKVEEIDPSQVFNISPRLLPKRMPEERTPKLNEALMQ